MPETAKKKADSLTIRGCEMFMKRENDSEKRNGVKGCAQPSSGHRCFSSRSRGKTAFFVLTQVFTYSFVYATRTYVTGIVYEAELNRQVPGIPSH